MGEKESRGNHQQDIEQHQTDDHTAACNHHEQHQESHHQYGGHDIHQRTDVVHEKHGQSASRRIGYDAEHDHRHHPQDFLPIGHVAEKIGHAGLAVLWIILFAESDKVELVGIIFVRQPRTRNGIGQRAQHGEKHQSRKREAPVAEEIADHCPQHIERGEHPVSLQQHIEFQEIQYFLTVHIYHYLSLIVYHSSLIIYHLSLLAYHF